VKRFRPGADNDSALSSERVEPLDVFVSLCDQEVEELVAMHLVAIHLGHLFAHVG
jgi:hypothetical protein